MNVTVNCPSCSAKIKAPDTAIGKTVKCPKCLNPMIISAPTAPEPEIVEAVELVAPVEASSRPRRKSRRDDDDGAEPRPRKKKSNKGLIIGLSVGGVLVSLCCCGGVGMYFGGVFDGIAGNDKVTKANYEQLKVGMTMAEVEAIAGSGRSASASDVNSVFLMAGGRDSAMVRGIFDQGLAKKAVYRWKNGNDTILILFTAAPASGGKAQYFVFSERQGNVSSTYMNGSLNR
jgi:F0F1-type ATP synthase membrane subunit c/vacuolar-type H+-ATPase subunit K